MGCAGTSIVAMGALKLKENLISSAAQKVVWFMAVIGCVATMIFTASGGLITVLVLLAGASTTFFLENPRYSALVHRLSTRFGAAFRVRAGGAGGATEDERVGRSRPPGTATLCTYRPTVVYDAN